MGEWRYRFTVIDVATRWRLVVSFTPLPPYPRGKNLRYPLDRKLAGLNAVERITIFRPYQRSTSNSELSVHIPTLH
jgi:hypothetical protein